MNKAIFKIDGKRVWIAGSRGLVGAACQTKFQHMDCQIIIDPPKSDLDLRDEVAVNDFIEIQKPDVIILAAAKVGGIADNAANGDVFYTDNIQIQNAVINAAAIHNVQRLVFLGSSCIYPRNCPQPIREEYLETGDLEKTNEGYARAKIDGIRLVQKMRANGHSFISLMPCNLYGENDHFVSGVRPHVVPALMVKIKRALDNNDPYITVWGTGAPLREFMHVDDLANGIAYALEYYNGDEFLNIGSGDEVSIKDLVAMLCDIAGYTGDIKFDVSKPDGTPRKILNSSKMRGLGWSPKINLPTGLLTVWRQGLCQG